MARRPKKMPPPPVPTGRHAPSVTTCVAAASVAWTKRGGLPRGTLVATRPSPDDLSDERAEKLERALRLLIRLPVAARPTEVA